jgi:hypothetical protein
LFNANLTKKDMSFNVGFNFNITPHTIGYNIKASHMALKLDSITDSISLKSIQLYKFEALSGNTLYKDINIKILGEKAEYTYTPAKKTPVNGEYKLTFTDVVITKYDTQSKWEGSIAIPLWTLKLDIKNQPSLQKYWAAVLADGIEQSRQDNGKFLKLSPEKQGAVVIYLFLKSINLLEPHSALEIESKIKRGTEILDFRATLFKEDKNPKLKFYAKTEEISPLFIDLVNIFAQPSAELFDNFREKTLASADKKLPFEKTLEFDLIEQVLPWAIALYHSK